MRKLTLSIMLSIINTAVFACPVCERNKPRALQGITHGANPTGPMDYAIVVIMIVIVFLTLFYSVKWLVRPNENNKDHIKYTFLNEK
jgi:hypothetical protein